MKTLRIVLWLVCLLFVSITASAVSNSASVSGSVRDPEGKPLAEATVTLAGRSMRQTMSDSSGHFRFTALAPGDYALSAALTGYVAPSPVSLHVQSIAVTADIILVAAPAAPASPLEFQSSGIRGLIDPGGYSASTASASSGVLRGIADLKRTNNSLLAGPAKDLPCALEPQLRDAVAKQPEQFEANLRLGQFYVAHDQPAQAIPLLQRSLALDAGSDPASRSLAMAWLESGNFAAARDLLVQALTTRDTPELHLLLARANEGSGLFQQAAEQYHRAAAQSPSEESIFGIGYELLLSGQLAEATAAFSDGIVRYPRSIPMQIGAGTARFLQGDSSAALTNFLAATEIDPADPRPYSFLAASAAISGDQQERVLSTFKRYLDLAPASANANYFYAVALTRVNSPNGAARIEDLLKRAIELDPTLAKAHLQLAESYARRGDFAAAVPEYEATLRLTDDPEPHYRLVLAYKRLGRAADSAREMQLFRQARKGGAPHSAASDRIDLAQFVSAIDDAGPHSVSPIQCKTVPQ